MVIVGTNNRSLVARTSKCGWVVSSLDTSGTGLHWRSRLKKPQNQATLLVGSEIFGLGGGDVRVFEFEVGFQYAWHSSKFLV